MEIKVTPQKKCIPICDGDEFAFFIRKENQLAEQQLTIDNDRCPNWWYTVKDNMTHGNLFLIIVLAYSMSVDNMTVLSDVLSITTMCYYC